MPDSQTASEALCLGIDVSHHQDPKALNWHKLAETHTFIYVRATYGTKVDRSCAEHLTRARSVGLVCSVYHFFRPGLGAAEQLDAFGDVAESVGVGPGWLAPALDVEQDKNDGEVTPVRYAQAEALARSWIARYGRAVLYTNVATWALLGNPEYIRDCDLWVANYGVKVPKTPLGLPWAIWQHLVAPLPGVYSGELDQNLARYLPILGEERPATPDLLPVDVDWDEQRAARDALIKED